MNNLEKFDLDGKTALITGGAGLLGKEHARALLDVGANVILTDVRPSSVEELSAIYPKSKLQFMTMDVTQPESIKAVSRHLADEDVRIDILVNNAAIDPKVKEDSSLEMSRLENFSLDQWNTEISVGLTGAFLCSKEFGQLMSSDGQGGVILNVASDLSVISPDQRLYRKEGVAEELQPVKPVTYSAIKAGMVGLTRYLATYWAREGVRCNVVSPGGVFNNQNETFVNRLEQLIPLGRMADIDEYHGVIQFLCSDASAYLNGQNLVIDGGRSVW